MIDLGVPQIAPAEWGARIPYDTWRDASSRVTQLFVHWPGTTKLYDGSWAQSTAALRGFERFHLGKNWRGLAYDYAIDLAGRLFRVRGLGQSGATGGDIDEDGIPNNVESDAVLLLLGPGQKLSPEMLETLVTVIVNHPGDNGQVWGHQESRQFGTGTSTGCPGPEGMTFVKEWRKNPSKFQEELMAFTDKDRELLKQVRDMLLTETDGNKSYSFRSELDVLRRHARKVEDTLGIERTEGL